MLDGFSTGDAGVDLMIIGVGAGLDDAADAAFSAAAVAGLVVGAERMLPVDLVLRRVVDVVSTFFFRKVKRGIVVFVKSEEEREEKKVTSEPETIFMYPRMSTVWISSHDTFHSTAQLFLGPSTAHFTRFSLGSLVSITAPVSFSTIIGFFL